MDSRLLDDEKRVTAMIDRQKHSQARKILWNRINDNLISRTNYLSANTDYVQVDVGFRQPHYNVSTLSSLSMQRTADCVYQKYYNEFLQEMTYRATTDNVCFLDNIMRNQYPLGSAFDLPEVIHLKKGMMVILTCSTPGSPDIGTMLKVICLHSKFVYATQVTGRNVGADCVIHKVMLGIGSGHQIKRFQFPLRICKFSSMVRKFGPLCLSEAQLNKIVHLERQLDDNIHSGFINCPAEISEYVPGSKDYFYDMYLNMYLYCPGQPKYFVINCNSPGVFI